MRLIAAWTVLLLPAVIASAAPPADLVASIERVTVKKGRDGGTTWFHPRGCSLSDGTVLWTMQDITGSDHFGPVHWMTSTDAGKNWSEPEPIAGLGRRKMPDGTEEGVCDVVPEYHSKTGAVLAMGHSVNYRDNKFYKDQPPRWPVYSVRNKDGNWSEARKLIWDDPRGAYIYTAGCAQRHTLPNGDILVPISFAAKADAARSVTTLHCGFDGTILTVKKVGSELKGKTARGLLEPSISAFDGRFYLTIRAEDGKGYWSRSTDGLAWEDPKPWLWDDETTIEMSTTQQRWLSHSAGPYLVYTRKAEENASLFRWRAPLYLARVDMKTMRLVRDTERVALPITGEPKKNPKGVAQLGNFHTQMISEDESWITVGEVIATNYRGDLLLARVKWAEPNKLAPRR